MYVNQKVGIYQIGYFGVVPRILYIGQSKNIKDRWRAHKRDLKNNRHRNCHLQNVYNKNGGGFSYTILEECLISELNEKEQYYIDMLAPECNIVIDVMCTNLWEKQTTKDVEYVYDEVPGLELSFIPKIWHKWVYGCGRNR